MACDPQTGPALAVVSGMAFEAKMAHGPGIHTVYGLNPSQLVADIERAIQNGVTSLLSFGTAAGIDPLLSPGTIVIAKRVLWQQEMFTANEIWADRLTMQLPDAVRADAAGVDKPLTSTSDKSRVYSASGAAIADMESHHVARIAQAHHLPFAVLRVVLDGAERALPPAALAATRPDGSIHYGGLVKSLLAHPWQLPALLRLAGDQARASQALLRCGNRLKDDRFGFGLMDLG